MRKINSRLWIAVLLLFSAFSALTWFPALRPILGSIPAAQAAPALQIPIYTPTPGRDGRIIYIVKANDTLISISLTMGVTMEKLRELNNLTSDTILEGQQLLLGLGGPEEVTVTAGPPPTATPVLPTPSPRPGKGTLCIILYNDLNGDSQRQESEVFIPGGAISFNNRSGSVSQTFNTGSGEVHQCFPELPESNYTISVAVPEGYNPTTNTSFEVILKDGDTTYLNFGAQANSQTIAEQPVIPADEDRRSPLLAIVGVLFLLAGLVGAIFAGRMLKG